MKKNNIKKIATLCTLLFATLTVSAQQKEEATQNTPAAAEKVRMKSLWMGSSNSAGLLLDKPLNYTEVALGYENYKGNFKKAQQGEDGQNITFNAEGSVNLKSTYVWGSFGYSREKIGNSGYNASLLDPYRGMPYYTADSLLSDWNKQYYTLQLRTATKQYWNFVSFGLDLLYQNAMGAKQRDPRSTNTLYTINVKPGAVFSLGEKHHLGLNLEYSNFKEESDMDIANSYVNQTYYYLYGLGKSVQKIGSGRFCLYDASTIGAGLQYNYQGSVNLLFTTNYSMKVEDVKENSSTPKLDGTTRDGLFSANLKAYTDLSKPYSSFFTVGYSDRKIDGIEYINTWNNTTGATGWVIEYKSVRSKYKTQNAQAQYELVKNKGDEYSWKAGATVGYNKNKDTYLLPVSLKENERLDYGVNGKVNIALSDKFTRRLLVEASALYSNGMSGTYSYQGQHPEYIVVTGLMQSDFNYSMSDYGQFALSAAYSQQIDAQSKGNLFVKGSFCYQKAYSFDYNHRSFFKVSFGCEF